MSKNIVIQEGGVGFQFTADKLNTKLVEGGTCLWGLQEETVLTTKTIKKDGTYKASDDGYYGYSQVSVKGVGKAIGKDGDGDKAQARTDPTTGNLVIEKIPAAIEVTTLPNTTTYTNNQVIDYSGMVVKMKKSNGSVFTDSAHPNGILQQNELMLPMTIASNDNADCFDVVPLIDIGDVDLRVGTTVILSKDDTVHFWSAPYVTVFIQGGNAIKIGASDVSGDKLVYEHDGRTSNYSMYPYTRDGYTVYYASNTGNWGSTPPDSNFHSDGTYTNIKDVAWNMVYGSKIAGRVEVPVEWTSTYDGEVLATKFPISVVNPPGYGDD